MDYYDKLLRNSMYGRRFLTPYTLLEECGYTDFHIGESGSAIFSGKKNGTSIVIDEKNNGVAFYRSDSYCGSIYRCATLEEVKAVAYYLNRQENDLEPENSCWSVEKCSIPVKRMEINHIGIWQKTKNKIFGGKTK